MYLDLEEITVLAVDDDKEFSQIIAHYLSEDSIYSVITAESGQEALQILKKQSISAIIADYQMPEMDGLDLLKILRSEGNDIPFVIFTGQGCESVAIKALNEGADFYLVKGEDPGPQFLVLKKNLMEIVARRHADEALRLSEADNRRFLSLLRATLDATEDGILVENTNGEIAWYNERLLQLLNVKAGQVEGKRRIDVLMSLRKELDDESVIGEFDFTIEATQRCKKHNLLSFTDGRVLEIHVRPQICEGIQIGRVWSYHDISERIKAENDLRESRERFRILFDNSPISHQALTTEGKILEVNQTWVTMLGYSRGEIVGRLFIELCNPSSQKMFSDFFQKIRVFESVHSLELVLTHQDGREVIVIADAIAVKDNAGVVVQIQCALRDITNQRKTEEKLKWTESLLKEVVDLLPFGICVTEGKDKQIIYENSRFHEIWIEERSDFEYYEPTLTDLMNYSKAILQTEYQSDKNSTPTTCTKTDTWCSDMVISDGRVIRSYKRKFSYIDEETRVLWAFEDISLFREQEEEIRSYARRLEILNRMITLSNKAKEIKSLCIVALQSIIPIMKFDAGAIYLINTKGLSGTLISSMGFTSELSEAIETIDLFTVFESLSKGNPFSTENITQMYPDITHPYPIKSVTIIPLFGAGSMLGVMTLYSHFESSINPEEKSILSGLGREIGGALLRLQDQENLKNSRKNLENLVNSITDMVFVIDIKSGDILDLNEEVLRRLGYCREELIGLSVTSHIINGSYLLPSELIIDKPVIFEHTIPTSNGSFIHVETSSSPGIWNVRNVIFCVSRDISESIAAKAQIRQNEQRLRAFFESSPIGIELYNAEGLLIDMNRAVLDILGITDISPICRYSLYSDPIIRKEFFDNIKKGETITYEHILDLSHHTKEGNVNPKISLQREIRVIITPLISDNDEKSSGYLVLVEDISDKRQAIRQLAESEAFNRGLVNSLPDYIMIYNQKGQIIYLNSSAKDVMRDTDNSIIGKSIYSYIAPEQHQFAKQQIQKRLRGQEVPPYELQVSRIDGTCIDVMVQATIIPFKGEEAVLVVLTDITCLKEAKEELEKYTQVLQMTVDALGNANKKLNLLSDVTRHDILNQVHIILNYLDLAKLENNVDVCRKYLDEIDKSVSYINQQIQFTRSYQDLGVNIPQWQNLNEIISHLHFGQLPIRNEADSYLIRADPLLSKVFENLLDNSVRHGKGVSEVVVRTQEEGDDYIVLTWEDNGAGVADCDKLKIFEKGFGQNTGFGLFLIREILALTGMQIREIGQYSKGACFEIKIPNGSYKKVYE